MPINYRVIAEMYQLRKLLEAIFEILLSCLWQSFRTDWQLKTGVIQSFFLVAAFIGFYNLILNLDVAKKSVST